MEHGARDHAKYSGSNAHRVLRCAGQVALCASLPPRPDTEHSEEGTKAHEILERVMSGHRVRPHEGTPDMFAGAELVQEYVENLHATRAGNRLYVLLEQPFDFPQNVVPPDDAGGRVDIALYDPTEREGWIIDYKFGKGIVVEPERNAQLMFYATSVFWRRPVRRVNLVVIQPRVLHHPKGPVREWSCGPLDLVEFQAEMEAAISRAEYAAAMDSDDCVLVPGSWCRFCPAETVCPAREKHALALAFGTPTPRPAQIEGLVPPDPADLGMDRVAHILRHKDMLVSWLNAVEKWAGEQARSGVQVPGHKLVEAQARRKWHGDPDAIAARLIDLSARSLEWDDVMPRQLIDVTDAEAKLVAAARKVAPKGGQNAAASAAREAMAFLTLKQSSGNLVLVPDTDARPAADRAKRLFGGVNLPT